MGSLALEENKLLVDRILAVQKDRKQPWNGAYGGHIENLQASNKLQNEQWRQYGAQQLAFDLHVQPGDPTRRSASGRPAGDGPQRQFCG